MTTDMMITDTATTLTRPNIAPKPHCGNSTPSLQRPNAAPNRQSAKRGLRPSASSLACTTPAQYAPHPLPAACTLVLWVNKHFRN